MRIAVGGFCHESNRFGPVPVTMKVLRECTWEAEGYLAAFTGVKTYSGGFIDEAAAQGVELVPTVQYSMKPSGPSTREVLETARDRLAELFLAEYEKEPYDGIALSMHGAGVAEGYPDVEGELLRAIREKVGDQIPIGVVLDLHGNITPEMMELSDYLVGCKNYPHTDEYDAGRIMFRGLCQIARTGKRPCKRMVKLPWLMVPAQGMTAGPAGDIRQQCIQREQTDTALLQASFFQGFPYADMPQCGVSVVTMAQTQECADRNALEIARYAWERRGSFEVPLYSAEEAVALALKETAFPVLINESADNPGGGAPGDGTHLLRELLRVNVPAAFGFIYDPGVAQQAAAAGVGSRISCSLGGKSDRVSGAPVELKDAYVKCVSDGRFIQKSPVGKGTRTSLGTTVCLVVGNVSIVVGSWRTQTFDDSPFTVAGVDWTRQRILALKSSQHFKGWWADKVQTIIPCDPPGTQSADLGSFVFGYADTGCYPLDPNRKAFFDEA